MNQPLYQTILNDLRKQIDRGVFPVNSQLPTEKELAKSYQVSRITSKRALTELEQAGLIYRVRGRGSFVKAVDERTTKTEFRSPQTKRILFLLPFANDLSLGNFTEELLLLLHEKNYDLFLTSPEFLKQKSCQEIVAEFAGLIYYASHLENHIDFLFSLSMKNFPVVLLDQKLHELPFPSVVSDNFAGGALACETLIINGHRRIGYIFGDAAHSQNAKQRYLGYFEQTQKAKLEFSTLYADELATVFDVSTYVQKNQLTALICENDVVALSVMKSLKEHQQAIPEEVSIIGFDDIQAAAFVDPPLTTIAQDFNQIGVTAGKLLIEWIETKKRPTDKKIPVSFVERKTVKKIEK